MSAGSDHGLRGPGLEIWTRVQLCSPVLNLVVLRDSIGHCCPALVTGCCYTCRIPGVSLDFSSYFIVILFTRVPLSSFTTFSHRYPALVYVRSPSLVPALS